jgi:hypothetical protein
VVTTELDFMAQDWYQARVNGSLTDEENNILSSSNASDIDRDGTVSVTMQATRNSSLGFTAKGTNISIADVQDPNMGGFYYIDHYNFQEIRDPEGFTHLRLGYWRGYGPRKRISLRNIILGKVIAQHGVVGYRNAQLCNGTTDYVDFGKASVTINAASAGCTTEDPCSRDPDDQFNVTINFTLPDGTTALSGTNNTDPGRTVVRTFNEVPSDNEYRIIGWKYQNVNLSSKPKSGQMVLTLHRSGRDENTVSDRIEIDVAGDYQQSAFKTESSLRVVCP